jgi:hypothetical protein
MTGRLAAVVLTVLLAACATSGTRVTSGSDTVKSMANSQQWWCSSVGGCDCSVDGQKATCMLVASCLQANTCKQQ